jgi:hypothetical protein
MSAWAKVGDWLSGNGGDSVALVSSILTGNIPGAMKAGIEIVKSATGAKTPEKALERLKEDPTTLIKLEELAIQKDENLRSHVRQMTELSQRETSMHLSDVADARQREVKIATSDAAPDFAKLIQPVLACIIVGGSFVIFGTTLFIDIPKESADMVFYVLGSLQATVMLVAGYYFGSSKGSSEKTALLGKK